MSRIRRLLRLRPKRAAQIASDVDEEIALHLDLRIEQLVRHGIPRETARAEALRRFGPLDEARRSLRHSARRREERIRMRETLEALMQDLRYAARGMRKQPGFAAAVVATLALGIGANATMFGIVDRLLLRPPAYLQSPDEAGRIYVARTFDGEESVSGNMPYRRYLDLRESTRSFAQTAAHFNTEMVFGVGDDARQARAGLVSASFWPFFGVRPALGRFFTEAEDAEPAGAPVAVLGYGQWQSRYGGDPGVLGKPIRIGGTDFTIIGVAPRGFSGLSLSAVAAFIPITAGGADLFGEMMSRRNREPWYRTYNLQWMEMIARRKPGVTAEAATADLTTALLRSLETQRAARPDRSGRSIADTRPRAIFASILRDRGPNAGQNAKVATWLAGVSALVLLIACANVANLLLARAVRRRREIAVRIALGVSRGRLLGQLLTESLLLAAAGAAAGVMLAHWGGGVLRALLLPDVEWAGAVSDARTLLFVGAAAALAGILTGLAPAVQLSNPSVAHTLKAGGREGSLRKSRLRTALLVLQGAISLMLLVGAGLFVRSLHNVRTLELGFDPERLLYVSYEARGTQLDSARREGLMDEMAERARALPTVEAVGFTRTVPFWMTWSDDVRAPGVDTTRLRDSYLMNAVSPEYFAAAGTRILRGRGIAAEDRAGAPLVAVLSDLAARSIWPNEEALGKCVKVGADTAPCRTVVGIAEDIRRSFDEGPARHVYMSSAQYADSRGLFVRTRGEARGHTETVRRELQRLMPGAAYVEARPVQELVDPEIRPWRLGATMFTIFGGLALLVAAVGLYSVISYGVAQRTHELGVRVALGARSGDVVRLVVGEGTRVALVGIVLGLGVALFAGRYVKPLLYSVSERDPATFAVVIVALLVVAVAASFIPALRASRVDPNVALRTD
ncbi:MAG TPA: ABC transporter permease [Gemmatimonadaceae bacterium]|nr:ABC transporter permease [Gemmatimonadaceae bacterium]